jgi:anti-anti-sigma regulatory factor
MVRLTLKAPHYGSTTVEIEGRIVSEWINVVETECQGLLAQGHKVVLDFSAVNFVGADGIRMIRRLITKGCRIQNCPSFIEQVLFT